MRNENVPGGQNVAGSPPIPQVITEKTGRIIVGRITPHVLVMSYTFLNGGGEVVTES